MYGVGVKGSLQLSSLQKLSRIKYHDINTVKHCSIEHEVSAEQISSCDQFNEYDLPSPSLLQVSLQLEKCVQVVDSKNECTGNNSAILPSESQCPPDISHAADFPLKRKRKFTSEELEQSPTEDTVILVHEGLTQCHSGSTIAIALPKTPVFGPDSDSLLSDKSVFTTVKKYKRKRSGSDRVLHLAEKTTCRTAGSDCSEYSIPKNEAKFGSQTAETKRLVHPLEGVLTCAFDLIQVAELLR